MSDEIPMVGKAIKLAPDLQRILAPNVSPMTCWGTNTYIVGDRDVVIIDPGPDDPAHLAAILHALKGRHVSCILVTHSHIDHSGLASPLSAATNAPIAAFGDSRAGRSDVMSDLVARGLATGGEGVDHSFTPDQTLKDGENLDGSWGRVTAVHTPGHMANHMCFHWNDIIFTGDHVMGWASSVISPPDGDLTQFMQSCKKLAVIPCARFLSAHGAPIETPAERLEWLLAHRYAREAQIISQLEQGAATISELTDSLYRGLSPGLRVIAQRNVFAHAIDLTLRGQIVAKPDLQFDAKYQLFKALSVERK
ncbi:MBL fold metallo-hydrolase [Yoonia maritima]|nr:MBL fold metallo-hydrolase [Yoonia maritima]